MAKRVQRVGHDTATSSVFTGLEREITVDLGKKSIRVHDGITPGGVVIAKEDLSTTPAASAGSNDGKMTASQATELANSTAKDLVQDGRLDAIDILTAAMDILNAAQDVRLTNTEAEAGANTTLNTTQNGRLDAVELLNTTQDSRLGSMDTLNTTQDGRLTANEAAILVRLITTNNLSDLTNAVTALVNLSLSPSDNVNFARLLLGSVGLSAPLVIAADSGAAAIALKGRASDDISDISFYENDETTIIGAIQGRVGELRLNSNGILTLQIGGVDRLRILNSGDLLIVRNLGVGANRASSGGYQRTLNVEGSSASIQLHENSTNSTWEIGHDAAGSLQFVKNGVTQANFNNAGDLTMLKKLIALTLTAGTNNTEVATTAFVQTAIAPKADLASPTFTGTPRAPTQGVTDNTTLLATTSFVKDALTSSAQLLPASTNTGNAYLVTIPGVTALAANTVYSLVINSTNTGASTININSLGVINIRYQSGALALLSGDLRAGYKADLFYNGTTMFLLNPQPDIVSFLPRITNFGGTSTATHTYQQGESRRYGRNVNFDLRVRLATLGDLAGDMKVFGLPRTYNLVSGPTGLEASLATATPILFNIASGYGITTILDSGTARISLQYGPISGTVSNVQVAQLNTTTGISISGSYNT